MIKATRHQRTALYRLFDAEGDLLYVGISGYPTLRLQQHAGDKPWWNEVASHTIEWLTDRPTAEAAEVAAIRAEKPRYNAQPPRQKAPKLVRTSVSGKRFGRPRFVPTEAQARLLAQLEALVEHRDEVLGEMWRAVSDALNDDIPPFVLAREAGISRATMYRKLRENGYELTDHESPEWSTT